MPKYEIDAIRGLVSEAQANAGGIGQIADGLPGDLDDKAFGEMAVSKDMRDGVDGFVGSMSAQFSRAEGLLDDVARTLDSLAGTLEAQEVENVTSITPSDI